ncbi:MAG: thiol reductase thioredoxin [Spirochaetaceae bacterium]|jgi:ribonucleoside-triphosphate reductase|nr:thiol reductase thioredoxin [Spirochaetaceae bacterium]GMO30128.1 MAG: hypothetical protein Pg6A_18930 [Termitinemataceae bacterium]
MRHLEEIERDLKAAREELANVQGAPAEVYSRIVGYYRSVRNWNKGKREEYGERKLYNAETSLAGAVERFSEDGAVTTGADKVLLFVRPACPACPAAKTAAAKLDFPIETVNADTDEGLAKAARYNVMSTPTAILLSKDGREIGRARDGESIAAFSMFAAKAA